MGASLVYLTEPNKEIEYETGENDYLSFAVGQMQGWRLNMVSFKRSICYIYIHLLRFNRKMRILQIRSLMMIRKKQFLGYLMDMEEER